MTEDPKTVLSQGTQEKPNAPEYTIEVVKDFDGTVDVFYLSAKDPNFEYRFLRDDPKNINIKTTNLLFQKGGWQICPKEHLLRVGLKDKDFAPDGLLRRGDQILAFMPKALFKEKEVQKLKDATEPIKAVKRLVEKGDPAAGAGIHETMKGIQTKKQLNM